jgi:hypothetical protein
MEIEEHIKVSRVSYLGHLLDIYFIVQAMELQYIEAETRAKSKYLNNDSKEQAIIEQGIEMQRNVLDLQAQLASFNDDLDILLARK